MSNNRWLRAQTSAPIRWDFIGAFEYFGQKCSDAHNDMTHPSMAFITFHHLNHTGYSYLLSNLQYSSLKFSKFDYVNTKQIIAHIPHTQTVLIVFPGKLGLAGSPFNSPIFLTPCILVGQANSSYHSDNPTEFFSGIPSRILNLYRHTLLNQINIILTFNMSKPLQSTPS